MCPTDGDDTASDIDTAPDASDTEITRYEKAFLATRRVLDEAIRNLSVQQILETDSDRRNALGEKLVELNGERNDLVRANVAFHAHLATMVPPTAEQVSALTALANSATQLTQQKAKAAATLKLATDALKKFAAIQDI